MKLILVYNADDGLFSAVTDSIHKIMSPSTYECSLCRFTFGMTSMHKDWRNFLSAIKAEKTFLHRNEFRKQFPNYDVELPAIITETEGKLRTIVPAHDINACENLEALISIVDERIGAETG